MKYLITLVTLVFSLTALSAPSATPPANYPLVNGVVRKIDLNNHQITLKHETIPNLNMPGMTMPFQATDTQINQGLQVGDKVKFAADENADGDLVLLWIEKVQVNPVNLNHLTCTGVANTTPQTQIELDIKTSRFSTIRYNYVQGSLKDTAYINSLGRMNIEVQDQHFTYTSDLTYNAPQLEFDIIDNQIANAHFSLANASMNHTAVECQFEL